MAKRVCMPKVKKLAKKGTGNSIVDVKLEGVERIRIKREDGIKRSFTLKEVSDEELKAYRNSGTPGFVLKMDEKMYYARIPVNLNLVTANLLGSHMCAHSKTVCKRLSALSDEEGGCAKVRECSCCIERYDWITRGYETFGTKKDVFVVISCNHFEKSPSRAAVSALERKDMLDSLRALSEFYTESDARPQTGNTWLKDLRGCCFRKFKTIL